VTTETVYVNATTNTETPAWLTIGSNPWLDQGDTSYIHTHINGRKSGDYSFPTSEGEGEIDSVQLQFTDYIANINGVNYYQVYLYDGSAWHNLGSQAPTWSQWQKEAPMDISSILNTWAKINACKVYVLMIANDTYDIYVSELVRIVTYRKATGVGLTITPL